VKCFMYSDPATERKALLLKGMSRREENFLAGKVEPHFGEGEAAREVSEKGERAVQEGHYAY
jgi:hypothetical protein